MENTEEDAREDDEEEPSPIEAIIIGAVIAVVGGLMTSASPGMLGPVIALFGAMLICTGLVLRGLHRLTTATKAADRARTRVAPRP